MVSEEEKSEESTAAPAEAQAATNSLKGWGGCDGPSNQPILLPSESDVIAALPDFSFVCENSNCNASESIERNDLVFTIGEVKNTAGTVDITFDNTAFSTSLAKFNENYGKHNLAKEAPIVVTLTRNAEKDLWYYAGEVKDIIVPVECDKDCHPDPIPEPSEEAIAAQLEYKLTCTNEDLGQEHSIDAKPLDANYISKIEQNQDNKTKATATIDVSAIFDSYNSDFSGHELLSEESVTVELEYEDGNWMVDASSSLITINVSCDAVPSITPDEIVEVLGNATVNVVCTIDGNHIPFKITADRHSRRRMG